MLFSPNHPFTMPALKLTALLPTLWRLARSLRWPTLAALSVTAALAVGPLQHATIKRPDDARSLGLESLRLAVRADGGVPLPTQLDEYVKDRKAAIQLGKALFWDMQVGSDGVTACASCHFHAGTDNRARNSLNPGLLNVAKLRDGDIKGYMAAQKTHDVMFNTRGLNGKLEREDFPFVKRIQELRVDALGKVAPAAGNSNDVVGSMGTHFTEFAGVVPGEALDLGTPLRHPVFSLHSGVSVRQVGGRNAPSVINAIFNATLFWDGHGNPFFNGQNQFGVQHFPPPIILINEPDNTILEARIMLDNGALAGQTSQPVTEPNEMAFGIAGTQNGRNLPQIGRKMLRPHEQTRIPLQPLALQTVSRHDSVLGALSRFPQKGLRLDYAELIRRAFHDKYWNSPLTGQVTETETLTHIEANFALFFGVSIAMYESTLVSDQTPFDKWMETGKFNAAFSDRELLGMNVFAKEGKCIACHTGPELTNASVRAARQGRNLVRGREMSTGSAMYDTGFYNVGITPTTDDVGRGGVDFIGRPFSWVRQSMMHRQGLAVFDFPQLAGETFAALSDEGRPICVDTDKNGFCSSTEPLKPEYHRVAVDGAFKTPGLRNVELTGPYFHNGGVATLKQVVQFFNRGGNFCDFNVHDLSPDIQPLGLTRSQEDQLVAFLVSLTDDRVRFRKAPFDHPELRLAYDGLDVAPTRVIEAVGAGGSRRPLGTFLDLDPQDAVYTPKGTCDKKKKAR